MLSFAAIDTQVSLQGWTLEGEEPSSMVLDSARASGPELRTIKTQISGASTTGYASDDGQMSRSGRRSTRGRSEPFLIGVAGLALR